MPPYPPRSMSSTTALLNAVIPVDEPPRLLHAPVHPAPVSSVHASAASHAGDPQTDANDDTTDRNGEDGSYEGSTPLIPPPIRAALPAVPAPVVEDDNSPERGVKTLGTSDFTSLHPVSPVLPPQTPLARSHDAPCRAMCVPIPRKRPREPEDIADRDRTRHARHHLDHPPDSRIMKTMCRIVAMTRRNQHIWHRPRKHDADAIRKSRARHTLTDEEQDWYLAEGRAENRAPARHGSALTPHTSAGVRPQSRVTLTFSPETHSSSRATQTKSHQPPRETRTAPRQQSPAPRPASGLRATAPVFTPHLPHVGPTQVHDIRLALQTRTPAIDHHLVRTATHIRNGQVYAAPPAMTRSRTENTHVRPRRHSRDPAATTVPRPTDPVAKHGRDQPTQTHGVRLTLQQPASYLTRALTRVPQNVIRTDSTRPSQQIGPRSPPASTTQQYPFRAQQPRQPRGDAADPNQPSTTAASHIHVWLTQVAYEPISKPYSRTAPATHDPVADESADRALRDYEYNDYHVTRREH
ncbi:hypothetical protein EDB85DRAFT_2156799 [Lactarius pseudohatsudake]|nr:hypothetical protein EDB85DRAFT_2156799 [Lactarius pseudohatsudake]